MSLILKQALEDLLRNKLFYVFMTIWLILFHLVLVLTVFTLRNTIRYEWSDSNRVSSVPIIYTSYDLSYRPNDLKSLMPFLEDGAFILDHSMNYSAKYHSSVFVVLGDVKAFMPSLESRGDVTVFSDHLIQDGVHHVEFLNDEHAVYSVNKLDFPGMSDRNTIIACRHQAIRDYISDRVSLNPFGFHESLLNLYHSYDPLRNPEPFNALITSIKTIQGVSVAQDLATQEGLVSEERFLVGFMLPLTIMLGLMGALATFIIFQRILHSMHYELTIHLMCGATITHVMTRFLVSFMTVIGVAYLILHMLTSRVNFHETKVVSLSFILFTLIWILWTYFKLKRANLLQNTRGDDR